MPAISYQFGPFRFDARERLLRRGSDLVPLTPKAADTLYELLLRHGALVEKTELMHLVWPETFVEETTLVQNVFTLRKVLGDDGQRFIETIPRRGYRFVALVTELSEDVETEAPRRSRSLGVAAAVALSAIVVLAGVSWTRLRHASENVQAIPSIAVLPFHPIGDHQDEYLGVAMADALISRLSNVRGVLVRPTSAVRKFTASSDPIAAARELSVHSVLEGTIQRAGDTMRVTVQLVDADRNAPLWSETLDVKVSDVFSLQDRITDQVARALLTHLGPLRRYTENADAHRDYLRGRYFWNKRTADNYVRAIDSFQSATRKDPSYALAYSGLADSYALLGSMTNQVVPRRVALPKALQAAQRSLQIDDTLAEAHASLGFIKMHYQWDWAGGEREFRRAIELNPGYATAHHWYAYELTGLQRFDEAIHEIREAQKADPVSIIINTDVAEILFFAGRYDEAIAQCHHTQELDPNFELTHWVLGRAYAAKGMWADSVAEERKALEIDPERIEFLLSLAQAYQGAGDLAEAHRTLAEWRKRAKGEFDAFFAGIGFALIDGRRNEALTLLEMSCREHSGSLILINVDPTLVSLRGDRRFQEVVHRLHLDHG